MGLPALRYDALPQRALPHVVPRSSPSRRSRPRPSNGRRLATENRARELFTAFALVLIALSFMGVARVAVTARAAATSIEAGQLRKAITAERLQGDLLEIEQSTLATSSRIQQIAGATMRMSEAGGVCYIRLDDANAGSSVEVDGAKPVSSISSPTPAGYRFVVASVLRAALGEAHVLLLGDVGLATSR